MTRRAKQQAMKWLKVTAIVPVIVALALLAMERVDWLTAVIFTLSSTPILYVFWRVRDSDPETAGAPAATPGRPGSALSAYAQSIIDILPDALVIVSRSRRVVEANRAARILFGVRLIGRDLSQVLRHPRALSALDDVMGGKEQTTREITIIDPNERHFVLTALAMGDGGIADDTGPPVDEDAPAFAIALHEVTAQKRSEQLRADFVANASHELRTPLASLIGFIETLQTMSDDDADARERFLGIMAKESSRMARLIDDLLSLSRIEMNEHVSPSATVDIVAVVRSVVEALEIRAEDRNIHVEVNLDGLDTPVVGDKDQLTQVFQNLLDNAIKYGRIGGLVRVSARREKRLPETGGDAIAITVFNEGEGIPREHLPRLTDRFYRVDAARSRELGGTGLGLAIVKHIVNRHRGRLTFESELGVGTTVTVFLPSAGSSAARKTAQ